MSVDIDSYDVGNTENVLVDNIHEESLVMSVDIEKPDLDSDPGLDDIFKAHLCDISSTLDAHTLPLDLVQGYIL